MLTKDDVEIFVIVDWSDEDPHDHIDDPILLDWIRGQILAENPWAWGCVTVTVFWRSMYRAAYCTPVTVHDKAEFLSTDDYTYAVQDCLDWLNLEAQGIIVNYPR